jgi:predicted solute-binding protein
MVSKVYGFSVEPTAFSPVVEKLDKIAIDKHTSRSEVIVDILFNHFGISNNSINRSDRRTLDFSEQIMRKIKT